MGTVLSAVVTEHVNILLGVFVLLVSGLFAVGGISFCT